MTISVCLISCDNKSGAIADGASTGASDNTATEADYCRSFELTLNGAFESNFQSGSMTWTGGREGSVEISGVDYNEMTCTYKVPVCADGIINMICNGAAYNTSISIFTVDSILLGTTTYTRVKS